MKSLGILAPETLSQRSTKQRLLYNSNSIKNSGECQKFANIQFHIFVFPEQTGKEGLLKQPIELQMNASLLF